MINPQLLGCNIEYGEYLSKKKEDEIAVRNWKKRKLKTKML